jgi:DeoR family transcriptional regulator, suf operon transcriptional repressor
MDAVPSLPGYRGTRGDLLVAVKKSQPITAEELAEQLGVTPNAMRRHLKELEASGIVAYRSEIRGVGRPVNAYSLTEQGEALFPRAYDDALSRVLEMVREQQGTDGVVELFAQQWATIAADAKDELARLPLNERAQLLAELLSSRGYMAEAESRSATEATIREHNCAIRLIAERFPEVCAAEARFLEEMLGATVKRQAHIASGANCCEYCVAARTTTPGEGTTNAGQETA